MAHTISLNLSFRRILQGSLISTFLKSLTRFTFFLFLFIAGYSQAYALTLSGTVYGGGNPMPNAAISLTDQSTGNSISNVITGVGGTYILNVSDGVFTITITPPAGSGFDESNINDIAISGANELLDVYLVPNGTTLSGTVYLPDGTTPASNVTLKIFDTGSPNAYLDTVTTGGTGEYTFTVVPGTYGLYMLAGSGNTGYIGLFRSDRYLTNIDLSVDQVQDITLPFVTISGRTVDNNGVAVGNVAITVVHATLPYINNGIALHGGGTLTSDASGNYSFNIYPYSNYAVTIEPPTGSGFAIYSINSVDLSFDKTQVFVLPLNDVTAPSIIAGPYVKNISDTSAVVEWQTNEPTTSDVIINGATVSVPGTRTQHSVPLTGLTASTAYSAQASSYDNAGNGPVISAAVNFTTLSTPDTTAPSIISGPVITGITQNRVLIQWVTSEPTTTSLTYGTTDPSNPVSIDGLRNTHELEITGLSPSTQYVVQVQATDSADNGPVSSSAVDFLTAAAPDTKAPVIVAGPMVTNITDTEVTMEWETDEPSVSGVSYNDGTVYNVYRDENLTTQHKIRVTSLTPGTPYHYTVSLKDEFGNGPTLSAEKQFTTSAAIDMTSPMVVEPLKIVGITHQSAVIHWRTDEPADSVIEYGFSVGVLGSNEIDTKLKQKHVLQLVGLDVDTEYFFRARSTDTNGNEVVTDVSSFRTRTHPDTAKPKFSVSPVVINSTDTTTTIYWETDEPTDAVVEYGVGQSITKRRSHSEKNTKHQVTLAGLSPNESYSFAVGCADASGNRSKHSSIAQVAQAKYSQDEGLIASVVDWLFDPAIAEGGSVTGFSTNAEADTTAPLITTAPVVVAKTSEYVLIRWVTDEAANSRVEFGLSGGALDHVVGDIEYSTEHLMVLPNVTSNTSYDFKVYSVDVAGNSVASNIQTIVSGSQADAQAPVFNLAPSVNTVSDNELIAIWSTDEYTTGSLVCVAEGTSSTWQVGEEGLRKDHTLHLNGIVSDAEYSCYVSSEDISGNKVSSVALAVVAGGVVAIDNGPVPVDIIPAPVETTTTDLTASASGGGGALHPLYLLFMMTYFVFFSNCLRKQKRLKIR